MTGMRRMDGERSSVGGDPERSGGAPPTGGPPDRPDPEVPEKPVRRRFSAEYKRRILEEADAFDEPGQIGALVRREGLYSSHLAKWRKQLRQAEMIIEIQKKHRRSWGSPWSAPRAAATNDRAHRASEPAGRHGTAVRGAGRVAGVALSASQAKAQEEYERQRQADKALLDRETKARVMSLATDFPKLWSDPQTSDRERKRMVPLLIEDVTLIKGEQITAHVRFKGGATRTLKLPSPLPGGKARKTNPEVLAEIDRLLDDCGETNIAAELNRRGYRSGTGATFTSRLVKQLRHRYKLKTRYDRLRERGMLTLDEVGEKLSVCTDTVKIWRREGLLKAHPYNDKDEYPYEPLGDNPPAKAQGQKLCERRQLPEVLSDLTNEVQHAV